MAFQVIVDYTQKPVAGSEGGDDDHGISMMTRKVIQSLRKQLMQEEDQKMMTRKKTQD